MDMLNNTIIELIAGRRWCDLTRCLLFGIAASVLAGSNYTSAYEISTYGDYRIILGVDSSEVFIVKTDQIHAGYSPIFVDAFMNNGQLRYCFIWKKNDGVARVLQFEQEWASVNIRLITDDEQYNYPLQIDTCTIPEHVDVEIADGVDFAYSDNEYYIKGHPRFAVIWTKRDGRPERFVTHLRRNSNSPTTIGELGVYSYPNNWTHQQYFEAVKDNYVPISRGYTYPTWLHNSGSTSSVLTHMSKTAPWVTTIYELNQGKFSATSTIDNDEFHDLTESRAADGYKLKYVDVQAEYQQTNQQQEDFPLFKGGFDPFSLYGVKKPNAYSPIYRKDSRAHHVSYSTWESQVTLAHEAAFNLGMRPISIAGFPHLSDALTTEPQYCIVWMEDTYRINGHSGPNGLKPVTLPQDGPVPAGDSTRKFDPVYR
jgi:hypothetical protein